MSWDAVLYDDRGHIEGEWNYTHNTNRMANAAAHNIGAGPLINGSWWQTLNGMQGNRGASFIGSLVSEMRSNPSRYVWMNPSNGWGNYDRFLAVLGEMSRAVPEWPCRWEVHG